MSTKTNQILDDHAKTHSATGAEAGFDFQFYAFVLLMLRLRSGETIEYDTVDDIVHIDSHGVRTLIQAKHTISTSKRLTQTDLDLWKSIGNWLKLHKKLGSSDFFKQYKFQILINRSISDSNEFCNNISKFQKGNCVINEIDGVLNRVDNIEAQELRQLSQKERIFFYRNFSIEIITGKSITDKIRKILKEEKYTPDIYLNNVYSKMISTLHEEKYFNSFKKGKYKINSLDSSTLMTTITSSEFNQDFNIDTSLPIILPSDLRNATSICQLVGIDYIDIDTDESDTQILEIHEQRLYAINSIMNYKKNDLMLESQYDKINKDAMKKWQHEFRIAHGSIRRRIQQDDHSISDDDYIECGHRCFDRIFKTKIANCTEYLSLGYFYHLSEIPAIGWRFDWKKKYRDDE